MAAKPKTLEEWKRTRPQLIVTAHEHAVAEAAWNAAREASGTVIAEGTLLHAYGNTIHFNEDDAVNMREVVAATGQRVHVAIVGGEGG